MIEKAPRILGITPTSLDAALGASFAWCTAAQPRRQVDYAFEDRLLGNAHVTRRADPVRYTSCGCWASRPSAIARPMFVHQIGLDRIERELWRLGPHLDVVNRPQRKSEAATTPAGYPPSRTVRRATQTP
jgi:hypothetical protein